MSESKNEEITVPVWWSNGNGMRYRRDCLPANHPEHTYNYMVRELNVDPEDYGVFLPTETCPTCGRECDDEYGDLYDQW